MKLFMFLLLSVCLLASELQPPKSTESGFGTWEGGQHTVFISPHNPVALYSMIPALPAVVKSVGFMALVKPKSHDIKDLRFILLRVKYKSVAGSEKTARAIAEHQPGAEPYGNMMALYITGATGADLPVKIISIEAEDIPVLPE